MAFFLSIAGLDGSGKSAQSNMLQQTLGAKGIRARLIHIKDLSYNKYDVMKDTLNYISGKTVNAQERKGIFFAYVFLHQMETNVMPELEKYDGIIMDRYVETQRFICQFLGISSSYSDEILELVKKPDISFFLDVQPATCAARIGNRLLEDLSLELNDHDKPENLLMARDYYIKNQEKFNFVRIDGNQNISSVHADILRKLEERLII